MLIVIEGCDASGKATQSKLLESALNAVRIAFPRYDGPVGKEILRLLKSPTPFDPVVLQSLMTMDKYSAAPYIREFLSNNRYVVLDRYWQSAYCYGSDDGVQENFLLDTHSSLPPADLNFFIDVDIEEATRRRPQARDRYEQDKDKLERIRQKYREMWLLLSEKEPNNWIIVDGHQDVNLIHANILSTVAKRKSELSAELDTEKLIG